MQDTGNNRFWISVTCPYNVRDEEWAVILMLIDNLLRTYDGGKFSNVHAHLEDAESHRIYEHD